MQRCAVTALLAGALLSAPCAVFAQMQPDHRVFPAQALRGELVVTQPPEVMVNGKADRLAPGVRIRNTGNLIVPAQMLADQTLTVHYTREATTGLLQDIWVLRPSELDNKPWPRSPREAQAWTFDTASQRWTKP